MKSTFHKIIFGDSRNLSEIKDKTVDFIVTSPPYPMIQMWDEVFSKMNPKIDLDKKNGFEIFELMHKELDKVWDECNRVLKENRFICINIGDATRTHNGDFSLYSNHSRIINYFVKKGFFVLPMILWNKPTNSPNKFMGSGMLPAGAYVTLEHEYILVFRKNSKRQFKTQEEKMLRRESAYFWEERNKWFSDIWYDLKGVRQNLNQNKIRNRSGAYPFELAYRLINMFSVKNDLIFDPFLGTGTTTIAAKASERNSLGVEYDENFKNIIFKNIKKCKPKINEFIKERIYKHKDFIQQRTSLGKKINNFNEKINYKVITKQETDIVINYIHSIEKENDLIITNYINKLSNVKNSQGELYKEI